MSFQRAMVGVRQSEGGYANDPQDPGKETYCGVSRRFFPKWSGWSIIDRIKANAGRKLKPNEKINDIKLKRAITEFYFDNFWKPLRCDQIKNEVLADNLFDSGINFGRKQAVRLFQEAYNNIALTPAMIVVDGMIGPRTISALNTKKKNFPNHVVECRIRLYFKKCKAKPFKYKYLKGWMLRSLKYIEKP